MAARLPAAAGSSLLILTVVIVPAETTLPHQLADLLRDEGRSAAERTWRALGARAAGAEVRVTEGDAREEILRVADEWDADLVVVGARGLGRMRGFLLGTVSQAVARDYPGSVLVVKRGTRSLRSALVGLDGSDHALEAVRFLVTLPLPDELALCLVGVVEKTPFPRTAPRMIRADLKAATAAVELERRAALEHAFTTAQALLPRRAAGQSRSTGEPAEEILRLAKESAVDLIVLGARGLGVVKRLLLGSVSDAVLRAARCGVLIVKRPPSRARRVAEEESR
ncbi:MAG: universal stress protein [Candidatus Rokuibacteriota bacterium]